MRTRTHFLALAQRLHSRRPTVARDGFTLVELLVVIAIIGVLVAILLPAIQSAREAARRTQCKNNLRNLALAANNHLDVHKHLPVGGWGWGWAGDPNLGYDHRQPGGWMYTILPFIEENAVHDMGKGNLHNGPAPQPTNLRNAIRDAMQTVIPLYFCPTRRTAQVSRFLHGTGFVNSSIRTGGVENIARNDYVACAGDRAVLAECYGPGTYAEGLGGTHACWTSADNNRMNGLTVLPRSGLIGLKRIEDGVSKTLLYAEKYLNAQLVDTADHDNDQGWNLGHDRDVIRWCNQAPFNDALGRPSNYAVFGAAHHSGMQAVMADASTHTIIYEIDLEVFRRLGVRNDKLPVQLP